MQTLQNIDQLTGLIATMEAQNKIKKDVVANSKTHLHFLNGQLQVLGEDAPVLFQPTKLFHSQMAEKMGINSGYYGRMLEEPQRKLLDENVNYWLNKESKNFLVRTFENAAEDYRVGRAFLSDGYSIIDNYQVLFETLEAIQATGLNVQIVGAELSDAKMYLKVICPEVEIFAKELLKDYRVNKEVGTGVYSGFTLQNSEVGAGSFLLMPRAYIRTCSNGMTNPVDQLKKIHIGAKMDELGFNKNKAVLAANLKLIKEQVNHAVKIFLSKEYLQKMIDVYSKLGEPKIEAPVDKVIQVIGKTYQISEDRKANILKHFIEGGDMRRMGMANAMTLECQSVQDVDLKNETETIAFNVLKDFQKIEVAAMKLKSGSN